MQKDTASIENNMKYIPLTEEDKRKMFEEMGITSISSLFSDIPEEILLKRKLNLPPALSEKEIVSLIKRTFKENDLTERIFLGGGAYFHFIPSTINYLLERGEIYTSYTPYQPEMSQGLLQAMFEFQSVMSDLTHADITNASMYDGASALAEAILMGERINKKGKVVLPKNLNPQYREVIETYLKPRNIEIIDIGFTEEGRIDIEKLKSILKEEVSSVVVQSPNYFGVIEDLNKLGKIIKDSGALFILSIIEALSLGIIKPPFDFGVDILAMEGQSFGMPLSFGGPYLGILQTKKEYVRQIPGRIVGETVDKNGKRCFVMTLRPREQDIRREKATSNICSNHALKALVALVYLTTVGPRGFKKIAEINYKKAHYLAKRFNDEGFKLTFSGPFFNEFAVNLPFDENELREKLSLVDIYGGIPIEGYKNSFLFSVTEMNSLEDIELLMCAILEG